MSTSQPSQLNAVGADGTLYLAWADGSEMVSRHRMTVAKAFPQEAAGETEFTFLGRIRERAAARKESSG
jgi:hypothetical protein